MNFRKLIEKAMHEAKDDFAAIIATKVAELMGDEEANTSTRRRSGGKTSRAPAKLRAKSNDKQRRAAPDHMTKIQEKVIHAMKPGVAMKKSDIMKAARLPDDEETRVRNILAKLKNGGVLSMKGVRGSAVYSLREEGASASANN